MAWITFIFDHLLILYIVVWAPPIMPYEGIINTFFMLSGAVLSAYIGFSTWDDVTKKKEHFSLEKRRLFEAPKPEEADER